MQHTATHYNTLQHTATQVDRAEEIFKKHLEWRVEYKLDAVVFEDFSDLKKHQELYWGGRDLDGVMTFMCVRVCV